MKKILIVLLGMSLTLAGCGNLSVKKKEVVMDIMADLDEDDFVELLDDSKYIEVDSDDVYYVKAKGLKGDSLDEEDIEDFLDEEEDKELYSFEYYAGASFRAVKAVETKEGMVYYHMSVTGTGAYLTLISIDEDDDVLAVAFYEYDDGEFELDEDDYDEDEDEYEDFEKLVKKHEKKGKKFFEKAFKELYSVVK